MIRFLQTPGPIKKIVLGGMLLVICGAMVITLVPGGLGSTVGLGGPGEGVIATVDGSQVTTLDVNRTADNMLREQFPKAGAQAAMLRPYFAQRALENLISQKAILAEASRLGLRATDAEVRDELQFGRYSQVFFPGGNFIGQDQYQARLDTAGITIAQFESEIKDQILFQKLRDLVAGSATVTDAQIREDFDKKNTKVKLDYAVLDKDAVAKSINPSEAELKAFYEKTKAAYNNSIPEKRKIKYAVIGNIELAAQAQVTPQELQSYYDQHREEYRVDQQVNVRHILIKTPLAGADGKVDQKGLDAARKKAEDILKQVKAGGDFSALAKKNSEDTGSAENGGSIGWIGKGRTVPQFESAAFSLPKGATSDLVQSSYGFHIIRVDDKQDAHLKTLAEVKDQIEPILKQQKVARAAEAAASSLVSQARTQGLDAAAGAKGYQVINTDFISRNDALPGIGTAPQFMDAVFAATEKAPPASAQLPQGSAVFQVQGIKPPSTPTFEEVRAKVETEFKNERTGTLLSQKTQELSDRAKAGHDLKKAAKELNATVKTSDFVLPDGQVPDIGSMSGQASSAFTMKPGEISGPIQAANAGIVFLVADKQEPTQQEFDAKKDEIRDGLLQSKQAELFGLFVGNLREQMEKSKKIQINPQEKEKLTRAPGGGVEGE
jgi:peptidyl-prolyl cis-trans isomerase D